MINKFIFIFAVLLPSFLSALTYHVKDISDVDCEIVKLNNNGLVTYSVHGKSFVYDSEKDEKIAMEGFEYDRSSIHGINNKNEVIGMGQLEYYSDKTGRVVNLVPFQWTKEKGIVNLAPLLGKCMGSSREKRLALNDKGWLAFHHVFPDHYIKNVVGYFNSSFVWNGKSTPIELKAPENIKAGNDLQVTAEAINNNGDVVGSVYYNCSHTLINPAYSFLWDYSTNSFIKLGNLGGDMKFYSWATDINDTKQVVGFSEVNQKKNGSYIHHAFLWEKGTMVDLSTLGPDHVSIANAINSHGHIVGTSGNRSRYDIRAFVWTVEHGMQDLNSLVNSDFWIIEAFDINDEGAIVCRATKKRVGSTHIILLTPEES